MREAQGGNVMARYRVFCTSGHRPPGQPPIDLGVIEMNTLREAETEAGQMAIEDAEVESWVIEVVDG